MGKRTTGAIFCAIAAFLFGARYICAAILMSAAGAWDSILFGSMLAQVWALLVLSIVALFIGVAYLIWAEMKRSASEKPSTKQTVMSRLIDGPADEQAT